MLFRSALAHTLKEAIPLAEVEAAAQDYVRLVRPYGTPPSGWNPLPEASHRPQARGRGGEGPAGGQCIPALLETPFAGLPEAALGTYMGDVALWVPEALLGEAEALLEEEIP